MDRQIAYQSCWPLTLKLGTVLVGQVGNTISAETGCKMTKMETTIRRPFSVATGTANTMDNRAQSPFPHVLHIRRVIKIERELHGFISHKSRDFCSLTLKIDRVSAFDLNLGLHNRVHLLEFRDRLVEMLHLGIREGKHVECAKII